MTTMTNEIKGYSLFNEVEDAAVRIFNRARTLKNIMLDHSDKAKNVNGIGTALMAQYFMSIPDGEKGAVIEKLKVLVQTKEVE